MTQAPRGRFRFGPIPHYSTTTPGGTQVSCGGCCLPLPVGCLAGVLGIAAAAFAAMGRRRH